MNLSTFVWDFRDCTFLGYDLTWIISFDILLTNKMEGILERHLFLQENSRLKKFAECDFNLSDDTKKDKLSIPLSLRAEKSPYLILFYYNDTNRNILKKWENLSVNTEVENDPNTKRLVFGFMNLNFERRIFEKFKNISVYSPHHWMKIKDDNDRYFVLFYYEKYPQYYFPGTFNSTSMILEFTDWENKIAQKQIERSEKAKQFSEGLLSGKSLFKAMKEFYLLSDSGDKIQIQKGKSYKVLHLGGERYNIMELKTNK